MRAEIDRHVYEPEDFELHPGLAHQVHGAPMKAIATQGILKKMHFYARASTLCQSFGKRIRYLALFEEEILKRYCALRGTYRLEQSRENLIAIF